MRRIVTLTTDFGLSEYPGICRAVIKRLCPEADVVDITHSVPAFDVRAGALVLRDAAPYLPVGVHVVIVDPGVGSGRRALALRTGRGDLLVGPDNGVLLPGAARLGGVEAAVAIENEAVLLHPVSATFHGRDVFCPAAAHLARGGALADLGPPLRPEDLVSLPLPGARRAGTSVHGVILAFDVFGSARTNIPHSLLAEAGIHPGTRVDLSLAGRTLRLPVVHSYAGVPPGEPCVLIDSSWDLAIAVNQGSAREQLGLAVDQPVELRPAPPEGDPVTPAGRQPGLPSGALGSPGDRGGAPPPR